MGFGSFRKVGTALSASSGVVGDCLFREIGWLFGTARGLEALYLGAECGGGFYYLV